MPAPEEINRLSELIWRAVKLRVSLLILTIFGLLVVWSGVLTGDTKALAIDKSVCTQMLTEQNARQNAILYKPDFVGPKSIGFDPVTFCSDQSSRSYIEGARASNEIYAKAISGDNPKQELVDLYQKNRSALAKYDAARSDAYTLQIQLSSEYSSSAITVNMLSVAKVAPFVALLLLSVVIVLGFQQARFKYELGRCISEKAGDHAELAMAQAQFFVRPKRVGMQNWFVLSPETLAVIALSIGAGLCLLGVLAAFVVNVIHLTDVIYGGYISTLFNAALVLCICLIITRRVYVVSPKADRKILRRKFRNLVEIVCISVAFLSLLLPWTTEAGLYPSLEGFRFVAVQSPVAPFGMQIGTVTQYPVEPRLYSQIRPEVDTALLFLIICALQLLGFHYGWSWRRWLTRLRAIVGFIVLCFSLNYIIYMIVLEYEAETGKSWDFSNVLTAALTTNSNASYSFGLPMSIYNPSYGFFLFLLCCFLLIWLSLGRYADSW